MLSRAITLGCRHFSAAAAPQFDVIVIGGGPGGYVAAIKAGQLGLRTACIESRGALGGTCLNVGCIPSKALLHASHLYEVAQKDMKKYGVNCGSVEIDLKRMMKAKETAVTGLTKGIESLFKKNSVEYVQGIGKVSGPNEVTVASLDGATSVLNAKNIIIATGSEVTPLPPVPVDNAAERIVDSTGALALSRVPRSMIVIGAGVIGLELGSVWRRLGSKVTVVEFLDRIVPPADGEVAAELGKVLKKQGMDIRLSTKVVGSDVTSSGVELTVTPVAGGGVEKLQADVVLVAAGRRPYTRGLGLDTIGVAVDNAGRIIVDEHLRTNVPSVYAVGDVIAGPMLAHKAEDEGVAAVENIAGLAGHVNYSAIPAVVYTSPELAQVGKTEEELKASGVAYTKGVFPLVANSRSRANMETEGLVKVLADKATDRVLGVHMLGGPAGEMIGEAVLAMEYGASSEDIARTCHAHPTVSEALKEAAMAAYDKPIHF